MEKSRLVLPSATMEVIGIDLSVRAARRRFHRAGGPRPFRISHKRIAYVRQELEDYIESRIALRDSIYGDMKLAQRESTVASK
jgi:hypothetical protein